MKMPKIRQGIGALFALIAGCMPLETKGYCNLGAGALKPESRKIAPTTDFELGAETTFSSTIKPFEKVRTGIRHRYVNHPTEKKEGIESNIATNLFGATVGVPIVDFSRFTLRANLEAGVADIRGDVETEIEPFGVPIKVKDEYQETTGFLGAGLSAEYRVTDNIFFFLRPEATYMLEEGESAFGITGGLNLRF